MEFLEGWTARTFRESNPRGWEFIRLDTRDVIEHPEFQQSLHPRQFSSKAREPPPREAEVANIFSIKSPVEKLISREGESVCRGVWCGDWVELGSNSKLAKQLFLRYSPALRSAHRLQQPLQRWAIFVLVGGGMQNAETGRDLFDSWQFLKLMATKSTCCVVMQFKYRCYELEFQHLCYNFDFTLKFEKENFFWSVLWI